MKLVPVVGQPRRGGGEEEGLASTTAENQDVATDKSHGGGFDGFGNTARTGSDAAAAIVTSEFTPLLPKKRRLPPPAEDGEEGIGCSVGSNRGRRRRSFVGAALLLVAMCVMMLAGYGGRTANRVGSGGQGIGGGLWGLVNHRNRHHHEHDDRESRHQACDPIWRALADAVDDEGTSPRRFHGNQRDLHEHHHEEHHHRHDSSERHHHRHQESHGTSDGTGTRDAAPHEAKFQGRILYSDRHQDAKEFDAAVRVWNERYNGEEGGRHTSRVGRDRPQRRSLPCAIVLPSNENDVALIVPILVRHNVDVVIKSGGHCYADYSSATSSAASSEGADSTSASSAPRVLLDLGPLNDLHFDVDASGDHGDTIRAVMGPGTTMGQILHQKGLHDDLARHHRDQRHKNKDEYYYAGVLGSSSTVAAGGYILGGGYGYWSRKHGLAIDNLVEARVVLANGTVVVTNPSQHSDLFWALRGAGQATFGVVTQYTYRLYRAHRNLLVATAFQLSPQDLIPLLVAAPGGDTEASTPSSLTYPADCHMEVMGTNVGAELDVACLGATERDLEKLQEQVKAYMKEHVPSNVNKKLLYNRTSWVAMAQAETDNFQGLMVQYWNGLLSPSNNNVETMQSLIDALFGLAHKNPHVLVDFELRGGAIAKVDPAATAYPWRNAAYMVGIGVIVSPTERHADAVFREQVGRVNTVWDLDIAPHLEGMFPNYAMESLHDAPPEDASRLAWGDNLSRLQEVKASYDPTNFFHSALPIELATPAITEEEVGHAPTPGPSPEVSWPPTAQPTVPEVVVTDLPTAGPSTNPTASDTAFPSFAVDGGGEDGDGTTAAPTMPPSISERTDSSGAPAVPATPSPNLSTPPSPDASQSASS